MFHTGFNEKRDVVTAAIDADIVQKAGASVRFVDSETGEIIYKAQGMSNFIENMPDEIYEEISRRLESIV